MRLKNHRDTSEPAIVEALRGVGAYVLKLSGKGVPDLLVCFRGTWTPLEVKTPKRDRVRPNPKARFTPAQQAVLQVAPYPVVETPDQALAAISAQLGRVSCESPTS